MYNFNSVITVSCLQICSASISAFGCQAFISYYELFPEFLYFLFFLHLLTFPSFFLFFFFSFCYSYYSVFCSRKWVKVEFTFRKSQQEYEVAALLSSGCSFNRQPQHCFANFNRESVPNRITDWYLVSFWSVLSCMILWQDTVFVL